MKSPTNVAPKLLARTAVVWWKAYALSALATAAIVLSCALLDPHVDASAVLPLFCAAVLLCSLFAGVRKGLVAAFACTSAIALAAMAASPGAPLAETHLGRSSAFLSIGIQCVLACAILRPRKATAPAPAAPPREERERPARIDRDAEEAANLKTAYALRATEKHFHRLASAMPQVLWTVPPGEQPDYCNKQYYDAFGLNEASALSPAGLALTIHPDDLNRYRTGWSSALRTGQPGSLEYRMKSPTGDGYRWHSGKFLPVRNDEGQIERWFNTSIDIEEQKRAEERVEFAQRQLDSILAAIPEPFLKLDRDGRICYVNVQWSEAFDVGSRNAVGKTIWDVFPRWIETDVGDAYRAAIGASMPVVFEQPAPMGDRWFEVHAFPTVEGTAAHFKDVTGRKLAEQARRLAFDELEARVRERTAELSELNAALNEEILVRKRAEAARKAMQQRLALAQEEERSRISRELHDRMGQYLTALGIGLRGVCETSQSCTRLVELRTLTEVMGQEVHRLAVELRPAVLDDMGLGVAVQNYLDDWVQFSGIEMDFLASNLEEKRLPKAVETAIYRVIQEALTNVLRHAEAKRVSVVLRRGSEHLYLSIEDDGKGFDVDAVTSSRDIGKRLGLLGMEERIALLGGSMEIESSVGKGTGIVARIPLGRNSEAEV